MFCPCGTQIEFDKCCNPFISGATFPTTAEKLMRSRYTAYALGNFNYLKETLSPESHNDEFDEMKDEPAIKWKELKIISAKKGGVKDTQGIIEFTANYELNG